MVISKEKSNFDSILKAGVQYGYSKTSRNPKMKPFICATKNGVEIFDAEKISEKLNVAKDFLKEMGKLRKVVLFVGTKKEAKGIVKELAKELNMPYVIERWLGGTLTNFKEIKSRIDILIDLSQKKEKGELEKYTKKERVLIDRKIAKLERYLSGLVNCTELPAVMVAVDSNLEEIAITEAKQSKLSRIVFMNSDCNPKDAEYFIPGNGSAVSSIKFILEELSGAYKEGLTLADKVQASSEAPINDEEK